jgi:hypothetical protein
MELQKFEKAKELKEHIDKVENKKRKLESALKSCSLNVNAVYRVGAHARIEEVHINDRTLIKEMLKKELENINKELLETKEEFENL